MTDQGESYLSLANLSLLKERGGDSTRKETLAKQCKWKMRYEPRPKGSIGNLEFDVNLHIQIQVPYP